MIPDLVALIRSNLFVRRLLGIPFLKVSFDTLADLVLVTSEEIKVHKAQALAKFLSDQLEPFASNMSSSSNPDKQEIESLQAQLEAEKTRNNKSADGSQPVKRRRIFRSKRHPCLL